MTPDCEKCHTSTYRCQDCHGRPGQTFLGDRLTCSKCDGGFVCPQHGKHWKR